MNREVYDKVYFNDDYSRQFGELRDRYHERTQKALSNRKTDTDPMPNATTVVMMEDMFDGGVTITTGDFVSYYNQRCGRDRIGEMRRSLSSAQEKVELKRVREKMQKEQKAAEKVSAKKKKASSKRRNTRHMRFSFAHALFALMLVLSMVMFFGTSALLDNTVEELKAMEREVATLKAGEESVASYEVIEEVPESTSLSGADSVEVYTPTEEKEGFSMMALLNALASLGRKE